MNEGFMDAYSCYHIQQRNNTVTSILYFYNQGNHWLRIQIFKYKFVCRVTEVHFYVQQKQFEEINCLLLLKR